MDVTGHPLRGSIDLVGNPQSLTLSQEGSPGWSPLRAVITNSPSTRTRALSPREGSLVGLPLRAWGEHRQRFKNEM